MAALVCTVGVTDRSTWALRASLRITDNYNAPSTLSLIFKDRDDLAGFRPAFDDPITITEGATTLFGGLIISPEESGPTNRLEVTIDAIGYLDIANYCFITHDWVAGATLKGVLQYLITTYFGRYGLTLATMADGPTMPALSFTNVKGMEVLTQLATIAGGLSSTGPWALAVSATKALSMTTPGALSAPTTIRDGDGVIRGIPRYRKTREGYADRVLLVCGEASTPVKTSTMTANGVATAWYTDYPAVAGRAFYQAVIGGYNEFLALDGLSPYNIEISTYSPVAAGRSRSCARIYQKAGDPPLANGTTIIFTDYAQFPFTCIDDAESAVPRETLLTAANITDLAAGQATAAVERARRSVVKKELTFGSHVLGWLPNQIASVQVSRRGIASPTNHLITQAVRSQAAKQLPRYTVLAVAGSYYLTTANDYWKALGTAGGSGTIVVSGGGGGGTVGVILPVTMGGSWNTAVAPDPAAYTAVPGWMPFLPPASLSASVRVWVWALTAGVSITARLVSGTDGVTFATVDATTNTVVSVTARVPIQTTPIAAALTAGRYYRVEILPSVNGAGVGAMTTVNPG